MVRRAPANRLREILERGLGAVRFTEMHLAAVLPRLPETGIQPKGFIQERETAARCAPCRQLESFVEYRGVEQLPGLGPSYGVIYWITSAGNTSYDAVIARYARRTDRGLNLHFEYTLGKTLSDAWESSLFTRAQIADCRACDKGPATFDVRSRAVGSLVWEVPYGRGRIASGWSISAITTFATGQPILLTGPNPDQHSVP